MKLTTYFLCLIILYPHTSSKTLEKNGSEVIILSSTLLGPSEAFLCLNLKPVAYAILYLFSERICPFCGVSKGRLNNSLHSRIELFITLKG